jgi:hypothetical protein
MSTIHETIHNEMKIMFTKFINKELTKEEEFSLTQLFIQQKFVTSHDRESLEEDPNTLRWLSLGWYIETILLNENSGNTSISATSDE